MRFWRLAVLGLVIAAFAAFQLVPHHSPAPAIEPTPAPAPVQERPALLIFSLPGCRACEQLKKSFEDPAVMAEVAGWLVARFDDPESALSHRVTAVPAMIVSCPLGKETVRAVGYKDPKALLAWLKASRPTPADKKLAAIHEAKVAGPVAPDGHTELDCDLPGDLHMKNVGGSDGAGLCVFTSINHSAQWQNVKVLQGLQAYMRKHPGGGYPEKVDKVLAEVCKEANVPVPDYLQVEGGDLEILKRACGSGRMPGVTYSRSPTGRYGGSRISHMVSLVHADNNWFCVLDNNYPGADKYEWMSPEEFAKTYAPGWAVILLSPPPPPVPRNSGVK